MCETSLVYFSSYLFIPLSGLLSGVEFGLFISYGLDIKSQELLKVTGSTEVLQY